MSLGEIMKIAAIDTVLGMGTVFLILIFISVCIWLMGVLCREKTPAQAAASAQTSDADAGEGGITPELAAVITAAVHQYIKDQTGDSGEEYIVRNVRRATWRHTS